MPPPKAAPALAERVTTERPFVERLVAFWSNHLCISTGAKVLVAPLAGSYEREAIRPHVARPLRGHGPRVGEASGDARLSRQLPVDRSELAGARARAAAAAGAARGLNENYARELLELHTLGVNGGYTQQDVQELAKMLTGWTVGGLARSDRPRREARSVARGRAAMVPRPTDHVEFVFQPLLHEPGAKTLLGVRYQESGEDEGERAIRALCRHPSTARFVATKLVAHFVSDDPPAAAVDRVARRFRETDGDLRAVADTLVDLPDAWTADARKFRTPQDWLVAMLRAFNASEVNARDAARAAAAPPSALVAAGAEGLRRHGVGMGRPGFAAQSRGAGAEASRGACACRASIRASLLDVVDVAGRRPAAHATSPTRRLPPRSASRSRWPARPSSGDDEMTMHRRTFLGHMCAGGIATFGFPVVNFAQVRLAAAASCSCCCAAASTAWRRSCRTAIRRIDRCAASSRSTHRSSSS